MAIVVVGAGAIGLLVAGQLADSGQPTILLARPAVAAAIEQQRLRVLQDGVLHVAEGLMTITDPAALSRQEPPELAILCVKAYDTASALPTLAALGCGPDFRRLGDWRFASRAFEESVQDR